MAQPTGPHGLSPMQLLCRLLALSTRFLAQAAQRGFTSMEDLLQSLPIIAAAALGAPAPSTAGVVPLDDAAGTQPTSDTGSADKAAADKVGVTRRLLGVEARQDAAAHVMNTSDGSSAMGPPNSSMGVLSTQTVSDAFNAFARHSSSLDPNRQLATNADLIQSLGANSDAATPEFKQ